MGLTRSRNRFSLLRTLRKSIESASVTAAAAAGSIEVLKTVEEVDIDILEQALVVLFTALATGGVRALIDWIRHRSKE
jgi:hypothetical protein